MKRKIISLMLLLGICITAFSVPVFAAENKPTTNNQVITKKKPKVSKKAATREKIKCYRCGKQVYKAHTKDIKIPHELAAPGVSGEDVTVQACAKGKNCCAKQLENRARMKRLNDKRALGYVN